MREPFFSFLCLRALSLSPSLTSCSSPIPPPVRHIHPLAWVTLLPRSIVQSVRVIELDCSLLRLLSVLIRRNAACSNPPRHPSHPSIHTQLPPPVDPSLLPAHPSFFTLSLLSSVPLSICRLCRCPQHIPTKPNPPGRFRDHRSVVVCTINCLAAAALRGW